MCVYEREGEGERERERERAREREKREGKNDSKLFRGSHDMIDSL